MPRGHDNKKGKTRSLQRLGEVAGGVGGESEVEGGAFAQGAGGPDVAAVLGDDGAADGEAEAGAAHGAGVGGVDLLEALEDLLELVGGDAAAVVLDFDEGFLVGDVLGDQLDLAGDGRRRRRELDGVGDEVDEHLEDAVGVGPDMNVAALDGEADVGLLGGGVEELSGALEELGHGAGDGVELGLAGADALEVEDVVDEADESVGVADGDVHHLAHFFGSGVEGAAAEQAEGGTERGERRAELVGDGGDELVLHAVELIALGDVGEGDDDADGTAGLVVAVDDEAFGGGDGSGGGGRERGDVGAGSDVDGDGGLEDALRRWLPASMISIWGRATYSTGKEVPSLRQKTSLATRTEVMFLSVPSTGHSAEG
jgi:hypothetical protein